MTAAARILFVAVGAFWLLIGVLSALLVGKVGPPMVFVSTRTDHALYGGPPAEILSANPELSTLRYSTVRALSGLLVAVGLLTAGLAWFGLRNPEVWALAVLTVVGLVAVPYWWASLTPYRDHRIPVGLGDIPPFMWVPAILAPLAAALGWIDLFTSRA